MIGKTSNSTHQNHRPSDSLWTDLCQRGAQRSPDIQVELVQRVGSRPHPTNPRSYRRRSPTLCVLNDIDLSISQKQNDPCIGPPNFWIISSDLASEGSSFQTEHSLSCGAQIHRVPAVDNHMERVRTLERTSVDFNFLVSQPRTIDMNLLQERWSTQISRIRSYLSPDQKLRGILTGILRYLHKCRPPSSPQIECFTSDTADVWVSNSMRSDIDDRSRCGEIFDTDSPPFVGGSPICRPSHR